MRVAKRFALSMLACLLSFGVTYALGSIHAGYPREDWWLALFLMGISFVPAIHLIGFSAWVIGVRLLTTAAVPTSCGALAFGSLVGLGISAVGLYTDLL